MPPEMMDFLTNLQLDIQEYLNAHDSMAARIQEGKDRGYAALLDGLAYPLPGELDHIDAGEIAAAVAAFDELQDTMTANARAVRKALVRLVRSWTH